MNSPYEGLAPEAWREKTQELIHEHPINLIELYSLVLKVWDGIFASAIGSKPFKIGIDIFPQPQLMGFFLHELIALELAHRYPQQWRRNQSTNEKDLVYIPDPSYSIEVKTSSSPSNIYSNRSYAQKSANPKKDKSGYYLAINFQKFSSQIAQPQITLVRFGWLDADDWQGQKASTGQQARLSPWVEQTKLLQLPLAE
jgi:hypothetical protein